MNRKKARIDSESTLDTLQSKRSSEYLESLGFLRGHSEVELWVMAVNEAWSKTSFAMNQHMRMYLSLILHRYHAHCLDFVTTLQNFCHYCNDVTNGYVQLGERVDMREMADVSLLYTSLFKDREKGRRELRSFSFMAECSADLYWSLGSSGDNVLAEAFREIALHHPQASTIIRMIREQKSPVAFEVRDDVREVASQIVSLEATKIPRSAMH